VVSLRQALTRRARELIRDPACWTQSAAARDRQSRAVNPRSTEATRFCGFGALSKAIHEHGLPERWLIDTFDALALTELIHANDRLGHPAVMACLKRLEDKA
jgi:hypothetical protein